MHAYIITGGTSNQRTEKIQTLIGARAVSPHDCITLVPSPTSIGVDNVRSVASRLSIRPVASSCHAVIIREAQTMTPEAQNAFLKTLEEPPGEAIIFLETSMPDTLLPTILSRCQLVRLGNATKYTDEKILQCIDTLNSLGELPIGKRLQIIDEVSKTRDDALAFVDLSITALEQNLKTTHAHAKLLRGLLTARTQLLGNASPKLVLDMAFTEFCSNSSLDNLNGII